MGGKYQNIEIAMTEMPMISILMAVYNTEEFLPAAIDSVIDQTFGKWELICINDGSTDDSLHLLHQYEAKDPRIIVIDRPHCGINASTRNAGLAVARGHYIAMLDSDDLIEPTYLDKLIARQQQTQAEIVISSMHYWDYKNCIVSRSLTGVYGDTSKILSGREAFALSLHWQIGGIGLHRADTLKEIKYYEIVWGDEYTARLCFLKADIVAFGDAIYYYRDNPNSDTRRFSYKRFLSIAVSSKLLTLIRKCNFEQYLYASYKEEVAMDLLSNYAEFLKSKRFLSQKEKTIVLVCLGTVTIKICKEFFFSPNSIKSIFHIMRQILTILRSGIKKRIASLIINDKKQ